MNISLETYFPDFMDAFEAELAQSVVSQKLQEAIRYSMSAGGKRIRPLLCMVTCDELGGDLSRAKSSALALECIHTYSLIHDDLPCMDDDDLRRGKPTNHTVFGQAHAVLAGDALLTLAFELLSADNPSIDETTRMRLISILAKASGASGMVGGQALDLESENQDIQLETLQNVHAHKTGALIQAAVEMGATVATDNPSIRQACKQFGTHIGLAFQISDDILDVTQSTQTLGKDAGSDVKNTKATYPALLGLDGSRKRLQKCIEQSLTCLDAVDHSMPILRSLAQYIGTRTT